MKIRRAGLFGSAAIVGTVLALAPGSALAYNSNNHGHHYGQLKHQQAPPPNPTPNPPPPSQGIAQPVVAAAHPAVATIAGQAIAPPATLPLPEAGPIIGVPEPNGDGVSWLVLLLLPVLAVVWLMVFARGAITMSRRMRRSPAPA